MPTPHDALHAALVSRPQQTARELAQGLALTGHPGLTEFDVEQFLLRNPRVRCDDSTPPRWRVLGSGYPAPVAQVPNPHPAPHVLAPAASFGQRAGSVAPAHSGGPHGILPAAAFGRRPSVRVQDAPAAEPKTPQAPDVAPAGPHTPVVALAGPHTPVLAPAEPQTPVVALASPTTPVRVPVLGRPAVAPVPPVTTDSAVVSTVAEPALPTRPADATATAAPASVLPARRPVTVPSATTTIAAPSTTTSLPSATPAPTTPVVPTPSQPTAPTAPPRTGAPSTHPVPRVAAAATPRVEPARSPALPVEPDAIPVESPPPTIRRRTDGALRYPASPVDRAPLPPGGEVRYVGPQLRRWQKDVLDAWLAEGRRGIVEAVSAQGRGVIGVLATWDALTRGEKVLVLVPTTDLLEQWLTALTVQLPGLSVGHRDGTTAHTFDECDVVVSLVSSASGEDLLRDRAGLLVADEVHRYGSARPAETLRDGFGARLGLTPSIEHLDAGVDDVLRPYFGTVLDGCDLERGRAEGVLAPFRLALVPVDLSPGDQAEHDALTAQIADLRDRLVAHGCAAATFHDDVIRLQGGWRENARAASDASAWLRAVSTRRDLLASAATTIDAVTQLEPLLACSTRSLVFTHTRADAERAASRLRSVGVAASAFPQGLDPQTRRDAVRDLRRGAVTVLTAPKMLDEGLHLPTIEAVVILAGSRSRRQLVQRVSPVLLPTGSDRLPVVVVVHARGTSDADDGFVARLAGVATEVRTFDGDVSALAAWFAGS